MEEKKKGPEKNPRRKPIASWTQATRGQRESNPPLRYLCSLDRVSQVVRDCIGFALLRSVIGSENSRHSLDQSDAKLKPITTWSPAFPRAFTFSHFSSRWLQSWSLFS